MTEPNEEITKKFLEGKSLDQIADEYHHSRDWVRSRIPREVREKELERRAKAKKKSEEEMRKYREKGLSISETATTMLR